MNRDITWESWTDQPPHLLIRASAGSGKTYRLSSRYLGLLRLGAAPETILATTFTRKAAGEVLARIITRLADAVGHPAEREALAEALPGGRLSESECLAMLRRLARSMHRLSIMTIDSFFNRIAQSFAYELDLPPEPELVDGSHPTVKQLRLDAIESMLADSDLDGLITLLRQFHHNHAVRSVTDAIGDIIGHAHETYRDAPQGELWSKLAFDGLLNESALQAAINALLDAASDLEGKNAHWLKAYAANRDAALARDWECFLKAGLARAICFGDGTYYKKPIEGALHNALATLIDHAKAALIERIAMQTRATHDLLSRFDKHDAELRRRRGVLLFSDLTHKLARELPAIGSGLIEDIYFRLDERVTHLLLDEFQDTSMAQWDVLRPFAEEVAATADGSRSLFVVGDTKQAIYGWRGGVAELFDQIEHELGLEGDSVQSMALSYRSSGDLLAVVNRVFGKLADNAALAGDAETAKRWSQGYEAHKAAHDIPGHVTLETSSIPDPTEIDTDPATHHDDDDVQRVVIGAAHERYVARRVKALYQRRGGAGSIGVLVRTNQAASRLIYAIGLLGLPVSGEGGGSLTDSPAVAVVLSALHMADHPGDTTAVFHMLNSPLAKVVGLTSLEPADVQRTSRTIRRNLLTHGYAQTLADWSRAVADDCDARGMTRLAQLTELADSFDPGQALRPSRFVELVQSQRVTEPSPAAIRVMTIHTSKGLEFDTVVLAELDKPFHDNTELLVEREHPTGRITGVYRNANEKVRSLDDRLERAAEAHRMSRLTDDLCTLYVGMTRARQALHMIAKPRKLNKNGSLRSRGLCYAAIVCEALRETEETGDGEQVLFEHGDPDWICKRQAAVPAEPAEPIELNVDALHDTQPTRRFVPTITPSSQAPGLRSTAKIMDISRDSAEAMRYGTLIHAWFEQVGFIDEDTLPTDEDFKQIAKRLVPGVEPAWLEGQLDRFKRILNQPPAPEVLSRQDAAELWQERRFVVHDGRELVRGCFDRVTIYRDDRGRPLRAVLTDFKTDAVGPEGTTLLAAHYQPQMRAYGKALEQLLGLPRDAIQTRLWFVGAGVIQAVTS